MSEESRCVVTLYKGVDTAKFMEDMKAVGYVLHDEKQGSVSNFDYIMTKAQADNLKSQDPRIRDIRYGSKASNGILPVASVLQPAIDFDKTSTVNGANWGLAASAFTTDKWNGNPSASNQQYPYTLTGRGVDVVIMDSGIQADHPEFFDTPRTQAGPTGSSRYQTVDWPTISQKVGIYTQHSDYHRDLTGHGTHVAGIATGKINGWAKEANIFSLKILDDATTAFGVSAALTMLRSWHNLKKAANPDDSTIPIRPTIVNMSWLYLGTNTRTLTGGVWRGSSFASTPAPSNTSLGQGHLKKYGLIPYEANGDGYWFHPVRVSSVESDIEDCIDDGIIFVASAGNHQYQIDVQGGPDYDNYFLYTGWDVGAGNLGVPNQIQYYHRGSTPVAQDGVLCVGAIDRTYTSNRENIGGYSNRGPRIDVFAPGSSIMGPISNTSSAINTQNSINYTLDNSFKVNKLSGTSMAAPQATGILAGLLQTRCTTKTTISKEDAFAYIKDNCEAGRLYDPTSGNPANDYDNSRALHNAPNNFLKQPVNSTRAFAHGTSALSDLLDN